MSGILFTAVGLTDFDPPRVIASPRYMNRILSNVIGNAIKSQQARRRGRLGREDRRSDGGQGDLRISA